MTQSKFENIDYYQGKKGQLMIKRLIYKKGLSIYASSNRALKSVNQNLVNPKGEIDKFTIIFGIFTTSLLIIGGSNRQKILKHIKD